MSQSDLDWNGIREMLVRLHDVAPAALNGSVLVGGAACWAYRVSLSNACDPDFKVPRWSDAQEKIWLSKDIDFANLSKPETPEDERLRIGYVQFGVRLGPQDFIDTAKPLSISIEGHAPFTILIADPLDLYREKQATAARRGLASDAVHVQLLTEFLKYELVRAAEAASKDAGALANWSRASTRIRAYAPEILQDTRLIRRLSILERPDLTQGVLR